MRAISGIARQQILCRKALMLSAAQPAASSTSRMLTGPAKDYLCESLSQLWRSSHGVGMTACPNGMHKPVAAGIG